MRRELIDIGDDLRKIDDLLEESGGELADEEIERWFAELTDERDDKVDRICYLIDDLTKSAAQHKEDAATYSKWAATDERKADQLKARLQQFFEAQGIKKLETTHYKPRVQGNGGEQALELGVKPEELPEEFRQVTIRPNNDLIREFLEAGTELEFARLLPRGSHLRLR